MFFFFNLDTLTHGCVSQTLPQRRRRPNVPVVQGALGSRCDEDTAKKVLLLFFPWTNDPSEATSRVPYLSSFKAPGVKTWRHALRFRLLRDGFPAQNFCFVYGLPRELQPSDKLEVWLVECSGRASHWMLDESNVSASKK